MRQQSLLKDLYRMKYPKLWPEGKGLGNFGTGDILVAGIVGVGDDGIIISISRRLVQNAIEAWVEEHQLQDN
jgi:N-dimethylarginine dimethylaminohydrolase